MSEKLMGYSMKAKAKREFVNPKIYKTEKGGFMVKGVDVDNTSMCVTISKVNAIEAINKGLAEQAF